MTDTTLSHVSNIRNERLTGQAARAVLGLPEPAGEGELGAGEARELFDYEPETGKLFWRQRTRGWFSSDAKCAAWNDRHAGEPVRAYTNGTLYIALGYPTYPLHRVLWLIQTGSWPDGSITFVDGDRSNTRWDNLGYKAQPKSLKTK